MKIARYLGLVLALGATCAAGSALADCSWKSPVSGSFGSASNWDPAHVPTSGERAIFNLASNGYTVTFNANYTNTYLSIGNDRVTFDLAGYQYTLTNSVTVGGAEIGAGFLTLTNGILSGGAGYVDHDPTNSGTVVVASTAAWRCSSLYVGRYVKGTLSIQGGAVSATGPAFVGDLPGSVGTVTVDGLTGNWANTTLLTVGNSGSGEVFVRGGAMASSNGAVLAANTGSLGTVVVDGAGSSWTNSGSIEIGRYGTGYLAITGGGRVTSGYGTTGIGLQQGSVGSVTVDGAGSSWTSPTENGFTVGGQGAGALTISGGGRVAIGSSFGATAIGGAAGGSGCVTVQDTGSAWNANAAIVVGDYGTGYLTVAGGARVTSGAAGTTGIGLNMGSSGTVTVDGAGSSWTIGYTGTFSVGGQGTGSLSITGGGKVTNSSACIGDKGGAIGNVTVGGAGSLWTVSGLLAVGNSGTGYLTIGTGGRVTSGSGTKGIGINPGSFGSVTVDGAGSSWTSPTESGFTVGGQGAGALTITGGGSATNGSAIIGDASTGTGNVTVGGAGSLWTVSGSLAVGKDGTGYLTVSSGGRVTSGSGTTGIGIEWGSFGSVTVDGAGSSWTIGGYDFRVGDSGTGTLTIKNGGHVTSPGATIAAYPSSSSGTVFVDGAGSLWTTGWLTVGDAGTGTLTITGGGRVTSESGRLSGSWEGWEARGTVTVRGAGSSWTMPNNLTIGDNGPGALTVAEGGTVSCGIASLAITGSSAVVTGRGSSWAIHERLDIGNFNWPSSATSLLVQDSGAVTVTRELQVYPGSSVTIDTGTVSAESARLENNALLVLSAGSLTLTNGLDNQGEVRLGGASARIVTEWFYNYALLSGAGRIEGRLHNYTEGTITVTGPEHLTVAGQNADLANDGTINLLWGGTVQCLGGITNYGTIAGQGTLSTGYCLSNYGAIAFTTGTSNVLGDVLNDAGGSVIISGGGAATFFAAVTHNGAEFRVSQNSTATFFGEVNGTGSFTGMGTLYFEGGYSPGASPAAISFGGDVVFGSTASLEIELGGTAPGTQYDTISVGQKLTLGGTMNVLLIDGFLPSHNDAFQVLTWGSRAGNFSAINGLELGDRYRLLPVWNPHDLTLVTFRGGSGAWRFDASGPASVPTNWTGGFPSDIGDVATFGPVITTPRQVTFDTPTDLTGMQFDSPVPYTVTGNMVSFFASGLFIASSIDVTSASGGAHHVISAPIRVASPMDIDNESTGTLTFAGLFDDSTGWTITKRGPGTVEFTGPLDFGPGSFLEVFDGTVNLGTDAGTLGAFLSIEVINATVNFDADQRLDVLIIGDGGKVVLRGAHMVVLNDLQMGGVDLGPMILTPEPATLGLLGLGALLATLRPRAGRAARARPR